MAAKRITEILGLPVYSHDVGEKLGVIKDAYLDLGLGRIKGLSLGKQSLLGRAFSFFDTDSIALLGRDVVLIQSADSLLSSKEQEDAKFWMPFSRLKGRVIVSDDISLAEVKDLEISDGYEVLGVVHDHVKVDGKISKVDVIRRQAVVGIKDDGNPCLEIDVRAL